MSTNNAINKTTDTFTATTSVTTPSLKSSGALNVDAGGSNNLVLGGATTNQVLFNASSGINFNNQGMQNASVFFDGSFTNQLDVSNRLAIDSNGKNSLDWDNRSLTNISGIEMINYASPSVITFNSKNLSSINTIDCNGLKVSEAANGKQGVATLVAGVKVVSNTSITASSRIFLTPQDNNTLGIVRVSARTAGTSFTINSTMLSDTGVIAYEIFEPG
jgi:hypothetical protein